MILKKSKTSCIPWFIDSNYKSAQWSVETFINDTQIWYQVSHCHSVSLRHLSQTENVWTDELRSAPHLSSRTPESWPIQFVFLWHNVLPYCSAPNCPISIPIEVLDFWVHSYYDYMNFVCPPPQFIKSCLLLGIFALRKIMFWLIARLLMLRF